MLACNFVQLRLMIALVARMRMGMGVNDLISRKAAENVQQNQEKSEAHEVDDTASLMEAPKNSESNSRRGQQSCCPTCSCWTVADWTAGWEGSLQADQL